MVTSTFQNVTAFFYGVFALAVDMFFYGLNLLTLKSNEKLSLTSVKTGLANLMCVLPTLSEIQLVQVVAALLNKGILRSYPAWPPNSSSFCILKYYFL